MDVIISATRGDSYRRCGLAFKRDGTLYRLLDADEDKRDEKPIGIGRKTYAALEAEAKRGRISIMPAKLAQALESPMAAAGRIEQLEAELAAAKKRIAELEAGAKPAAEKKGR